MSKLARAGLLILSICLSAPFARAQVQQSSSDSATVIRATTRLVQLDVVVTDSSGHPPKDHLSEKDFTILEDGKPQKLSFFSFQQLEGQEKRQRPVPPQLPPHVATNRPEYRRAVGPPVILLLDGINTPVENQIVVRQQMLKFMADHFDPHLRIAVFREWEARTSNYSHHRLMGPIFPRKPLPKAGPGAGWIPTDGRS